jgi:4-hydroxy-4-methyl-2-oxoglutarate aldolase
MNSPVSPELLESLRRLDTCTVSNAIESFKVRLRNEGFTGSRLHCLFPSRPPVVGYAVTARIHTSNPPVKGRAYVDRTDWWNHILTIPAPRIVVIQDADEIVGLGAFIGEVHANILQALDAVAVITNGSVRDLRALQTTRLQIFASGFSVSHAYAHLVEFGQPVEIGGLKVNPRDLLHADAHGVLAIPETVAAKVPLAAAEIIERERKVVALCRSAEFSLATLTDAVHGVFPDHRPLPNEPMP